MIQNRPSTGIPGTRHSPIEHLALEPKLRREEQLIEAWDLTRPKLAEGIKSGSIIILGTGGESTSYGGMEFAKIFEPEQKVASEIDIIYNTGTNCITLGDLLEAGFTDDVLDPDHRLNYKNDNNIQLYYDALVEHLVYGDKVIGLDLYFGNVMKVKWTYGPGDQRKDIKLGYHYSAYFKDIEVFKKFIKEIDLDSYIGKPDKFVPPEILNKYNNDEWGAATFLQ